MVFRKNGIEMMVSDPALYRIYEDAGWKPVVDVPECKVEQSTINEDKIETPVTPTVAEVVNVVTEEPEDIKTDKPKRTYNKHK